VRAPASQKFPEGDNILQPFSVGVILIARFTQKFPEGDNILQPFSVGVILIARFTQKFPEGDNIPQPRVARHELPWVGTRTKCQP
jgi:hypothetical protein